MTSDSAGVTAKWRATLFQEGARVNETFGASIPETDGGILAFFLQFAFGGKTP